MLYMPAMFKALKGALNIAGTKRKNSRARFFKLRPIFAKVNEKLFFSLWRLRFLAMGILSLLLKLLLQAYIGELTLSILIRELLLKL